MLDFLGIGAQKSGTTWLYETLLQHPKIAFPGGKEVHYWDQPNGRSIEWYSSIFDDGNSINGDITPAYGILSPATIAQIYKSFPHLRLIYLIRDPAERAWSSARMALGRAEMTLEEASDQWFIDHFLSKGSLSRGDYETCIRNWRGAFPSERLLILSFDLIKKDPVLAANKVLCHVGLEPYFEPSDAEQLSKKVFEGDGQAIRPSLLPTLEKLYRGKMTSFGAFLNDRP